MVVTVAAGGAFALSGTGLAQTTGDVLGLSPEAGPPGTEYEVAVTCGEQPTLYGRPLDGNPPGTQVPLSVEQAGPSVWTAVGVAGAYDDTYGAVCGEETAQARFDSDAPRLYLGPLAESIMDHGRPKTTVEGTDCPAGTIAAVTLTVGNEVTEHIAPIDEFGDWALPLPADALTAGLVVEASCGDVVYDPLTTPSTATPTTPTAPATPTPAPAPAGARPGQAAYTG